MLELRQATGVGGDGPENKRSAHFAEKAAEAAYRGGLQRLADIFLDCVVETIEDRLRTGDRTRALEHAAAVGRKSRAVADMA